MTACGKFSATSPVMSVGMMPGWTTLTVMLRGPRSRCTPRAYPAIAALVPACKWPIGDPSSREFSFCGRRASEGVYCVEHARVAYQPQVKRGGKDGASELARSLRRYI